MGKFSILKLSYTPSIPCYKIVLQAYIAHKDATNKKSDSQPKYFAHILLDMNTCNTTKICSDVAIALVQ